MQTKEDIRVVSKGLFKRIYGGYVGTCIHTYLCVCTCGYKGFEVTVVPRVLLKGGVAVNTLL